MKYQATFIGRLSGSQGISCEITAEVQGDNEEEARLRLYDHYEHIMKLRLEPARAGEESQENSI